MKIEKLIRKILIELLYRIAMVNNPICKILMLSVFYQLFLTIY
jgi:hypothetical protein